MFNLPINFRALIALLALSVLIACTDQTTETAVEPVAEQEEISAEWLSGYNAAELIRQQLITSEQLVSYYLEKIEADNLQGHELRAIIDVNPDALETARQKDQQLAEGESPGLLHGLPVVLKANIATADNMPTTAGALVLEGFLAGTDAELVAQLRHHGAVILGKANLSEWANFRGQNSSSGWSGLGGQARNPYVLTHSPCGSSSGSATAVAADFALLAVGTETDGSIMCPAAINGVVGIKPTRSAVSGHGIIPIASAQDIAGPIARTVFGAALLLDAMATEQAKSYYRGRVSDAANAESSTQRVVLVRAYDAQFQGIQNMTDDVRHVLERQGIEVIEVDEWQLPGMIYQDEFDVLLYEFQRDLNAWLIEFEAHNHEQGRAKDMQAIIEFNEANADQVLHFYGQEYFEQAAAIDLEEQESEYLEALQRSRRVAEAHLNQYLLHAKADAILIPSYGPAWPIDHENGDAFNFGTSTAAAVSGYPSITIPAGQQGELPLGLSIIGLPWSEPELASLAAMLEQYMGGFQPPEFLQSESAMSP